MLKVGEVEHMVFFTCCGYVDINILGSQAIRNRFLTLSWPIRQTNHTGFLLLSFPGGDTKFFIPPSTVTMLKKSFRALIGFFIALRNQKTIKALSQPLYVPAKEKRVDLQDIVLCWSILLCCLSPFHVRFPILPI